jgi:hypothetical protein
MSRDEYVVGTALRASSLSRDWTFAFGLQFCSGKPTISLVGIMIDLFSFGGTVRVIRCSRVRSQRGWIAGDTLVRTERPMYVYLWRLSLVVLHQACNSGSQGWEGSPAVSTQVLHFICYLCELCFAFKPFCLFHYHVSTTSHSLVKI